jgi:acyl-coenzyme A synthetase/AMP-(fatty) acid ligase
MSEAAQKFINDLNKKDFVSADKGFQDLLNTKLKDNLDQAKIRLSTSIFNPAGEVDVDATASNETEDEVVDQEAEAAADEVESEVEAADEIELDDEEKYSD